MSLFGNLSQLNTSTQPSKPAFSFGNQSTGPGSSSLFGQAKPAEQKPFSFGTSATQSSSGSMFGQATSNQAQAGGLFGLSSNPQQQGGGPSIFGGSSIGQSTQQQNQQSQQQPQRPLDQTLRFGQSTTEQQQQQHAQSMWEEGRGLGVYRSIPAQMNIIKDKWDAATLSSPLRTYIFQHVADEKEALMYRPDASEDENKWDEAVSKRPGPTWVPLLLRGFFELGKKAQLQAEAMQRCNMILQEINNSLDMQLDVHRQKVAARLSEAKRRQLAISRRTLALAVNVQILRNKGYVMDNAEEELRAKLEKLERDVFDPSLEAREQEIWARMLGVRERAKRLKTEMDRLAPVANADGSTLDENTIRSAKMVLEDFQQQLKFILEEADRIQKDYDAWEKLSKSIQDDSLSLRR